MTPGVSRKGGRVLYNISLTNQPGSWNLEKMHAKTSSDPRCFKKRWVGSLPGSAIMDWCHWKADKLGYLRRKFYIQTAIYRSGNIYMFIHKLGYMCSYYKLYILHGLPAHKGTNFQLFRYILQCHKSINDGKKVKRPKLASSIFLTLTLFLSSILHLLLWSFAQSATW